jgi:hypothetical protein
MIFQNKSIVKVIFFKGQQFRARSVCDSSQYDLTNVAENFLFQNYSRK